MTEQLPIIVPLLASIAVTVIFCLINGFGVAYLKMHAFIITLGTQLIAYGANCLYIEAQSAGSAQALAVFDRNFVNIAGGNIRIGSVNISYLIVIFLVVAALMWVVWNKTRLGKNMFAVGGNQEAAAVSGVNVARTIMLVYLVAGILYGLASFLEASRLQSVGTNTGLNYETDAISACVIGGVSFSGGVGHHPGCRHRRHHPPGHQLLPELPRRQRLPAVHRARSYHRAGRGHRRAQVPGEEVR